MDGQRRVTRSMNRVASINGDCRLLFRIVARTGAVALLALSLIHGIVQSGHLNYPGSPWLKLPGKFAGLVGLAADDIRLSGLDHHDPSIVLDAIGVKPGSSLLGFDAAAARNTLEGIDWIAAASVQRIFPNQLEIALVERQPFAVWQHNNNYSVIDRAGAPMGGFNIAEMKQLPFVTGVGANTAIAELVKDLEATPAISLKLFAAARIGQRRWTLYLDNGVKISLPERNVPAALAKAAELELAQGLFTKGIREIDLRLQGQFGVALAISTKDVKLSADQ